mgnify:CR=1 FL=1
MQSLEEIEINYYIKYKVINRRHTELVQIYLYNSGFLLPPVSCTRLRKLFLWGDTDSKSIIVDIFQAEKNRDNRYISILSVPIVITKEHSRELLDVTAYIESHAIHNALLIHVTSANPNPQPIIVQASFV